MTSLLSKPKLKKLVLLDLMQIVQRMYQEEYCGQKGTESFKAEATS